VIGHVLLLLLGSIALRLDQRNKSLLPEAQASLIWSGSSSRLRARGCCNFGPS
jgi:hypothetical protein